MNWRRVNSPLVLFILAILLWAGLFMLANVFRVVPGPYIVDGISTPNRIAAFEVDKVAMLASIVAVLVYTAIVHPRNRPFSVLAFGVVCLTLMLQVWELFNRIGCKMAADNIAIEATGFTGAKGLCAREMGYGPQAAMIGVAIVFMAIIIVVAIWQYRKTGNT